MTRFWVDWHTQFDNYSHVVFGNASITPKNLTLYGGVPQVTEEFDTTQVCLFVQDSVEGEFKQKMSDGWVHWKNENN